MLSESPRIARWSRPLSSIFNMVRNNAVHINEIEDQLSEDPRRDPIEKETAVQIAGDKEQFEITSFKRTVYTGLLAHSESEINWINVCDENGREFTVESLGAVKENPDLTVIGVTATLPVGSLSIGVPRQSDSHAQIVKT